MGRRDTQSRYTEHHGRQIQSHLESSTGAVRQVLAGEERPVLSGFSVRVVRRDRPSHPQWITNRITSIPSYASSLRRSSTANGKALGKMPTTFERRLISLFNRSSGLLDQILRQCAVGNAVNARTSVRAARIDSAAFGNRSSRVAVTSSQRASTARRVCRARRSMRNAAATNSPWRLRHGREQVAGVVHAAALPRRSGEALADRCLEPGVRVGDHQTDPAESAVT